MPSIAWLPWSAESFTRARTVGRPVLLSIAPTWCRHSLEMDRSSFQDPAVVALVEERFVPVRVDADRRPDICERYSLGGWPTTAFLTPDGDVLGGGTFVDRTRLAAALERLADAFSAGVARRAPPSGSGEAVLADSPVTAAQLAAQVDGYFDAEHGGFGGPPKFPHAAPVQLALARYRDDGSTVHHEMAVKSLDAIGWGPLHDDLNGGFFRYSSSADWSGPQQEKLLDVNAALLGLYVDAFETLQLARYAERAEDVLRYVQTWLADPVEGGWAGSQRADPDYYAASSEGAGGAAAPPIDRTLYTDWNASMASAALRAGRVLNDPGLSEFAIRSLERVAELCYLPGGGVAHFHDREPQVRGLLGDQMAMAAAQLDAFEATGNVVYRMLAEELVLHAIRTMWDESGGGFFDHAPDPGTDVGLLERRVKPFAANCSAARVLRRTARASGRDELTAAAERTLVAIRRDAAGAGPLAAELALAMTTAGE